MKLKLDQIFIGYAALQQVGSEKLPIKLSFTLQRNMRLLAPEAEGYEKSRVALIKTKYGVEQKNGNFSVPPKNMEAFQKEMDELGKSEIELDIKTIAIDQAEALQISPVQFDALEWMFVENEVVPV